MFLKSRKVLYLFLLLLFISACEKKGVEYAPQYSQTKPIKSNVYIFGVHPLHNPSRLFKVYQPMVDYINARLDGAKLKLEASRDYPAYDKKLFSSHFHFALPNPYQTVMATKFGYKIFGKMGDDENFRGIILLRKDGKIESVEDLKGKTISYPAPTALAATMMPQWYLYTHGIDINKDITNSYVGSQESSIMNVYLGKSAASSTWPPPWQAFIKNRPEIAKDLVVKWTTEPLVNNGLVAREDIPQSVVDKVSEIIFSLHTTSEGKKILEAMELSKYEPADDATYESVRNFLKHFEEKVRKIRVQE